MQFLLSVATPIENIVPVTDLTSLITTVASATAALVAIIGGFLVSRVISLSTENGGIKRRLNELQHDIDNKNQIFDDVNEWLLKFDIDNFVTTKVIEMVVAEQSLDTILEETRFDSLTIQELEPTYIQLNEMTNEMYEYLKKRDDNEIDDFDINETDFKEIQKDAFNTGMKDIYEYESWYEMIYDELQFRILEELPEPTQTIGQGAWAIEIPKFNIRVGSLPPASRLNISSVKKDYTVFHQRDNERADAQYALALLKGQYEELEKTYNDYAKPKGVISGLLVLAYASVVSIAYPLTLLPYETNHYNDSQTKWLILSLFFSQFLLLFAYLFWQVRQLSFTKKSA